MASKNRHFLDLPYTISSPEKIKIGIIVSEWNKEVTDNLYNACYTTLVKHKLHKENIIKFNVPGSFELIFSAKKLSKENKFNAIIAIGSIIKGETPHFHYICQAVSLGIQKINLNSSIPVIFGVLTDDNIEQAINRSGGKYGNKGVEMAIASLKMIEFTRL